MGAFKGLSEYLNSDLVDYAKQLRYDGSNIAILEGDLNRLQSEYRQIYDNLLSCVHHADNRSPIVYGQDLVASWIFEDLFLLHLGDKLDIKPAGADRARLVLPNQKTQTTSDYLITPKNGQPIGLELVNDYTGFWYKNEKLHLRDNKYLRLQKEHNLLLAIALNKNVSKFTIFDFRDTVPAKYIESHRPYGGKPAYELPVDRAKLYDFSWEKAADELSSKI